MHFETYSNNSEDWGVWYDFGESFDLLASGVRRAREGWRRRRVVGGGREGKEEREGRAWVGCAGGSWSNLFVVIKLFRSERC